MRIYTGGMVAALVVAGALLAGCTGTDPVVLPNGRMGYTVTCSSNFNTWSDCDEAAGELCPHGYTVERKSDTPVGSLWARSDKRSMLIECKGGKSSGSPR